LQLNPDPGYLTQHYFDYDSDDYYFYSYTSPEYGIYFDPAEFTLGTSYASFVLDAGQLGVGTVSPGDQDHFWICKDNYQTLRVYSLVTSIDFRYIIRPLVLIEDVVLQTSISRIRRLIMDMTTIMDRDIMGRIRFTRPRHILITLLQPRRYRASWKWFGKTNLNSDVFEQLNSFIFSSLLELIFLFLLYKIRRIRCFHVLFWFHWMEIALRLWVCGVENAANRKQDLLQVGTRSL